MHKLIIGALAAAVATTALGAPVGVRVTGASQADGELLKDILQNVTMFGDAFNCPAPSVVEMSIIPASRIPASADYRASSEHAAYEEWDANFCGKTEPFFISFWPDPKGGSFINVIYPYPDAAPRGKH